MSIVSNKKKAYHDYYFIEEKYEAALSSKAGRSKPSVPVVSSSGHHVIVRDGELWLLGDISPLLTASTHVCPGYDAYAQTTAQSR